MKYLGIIFLYVLLPEIVLSQKRIDIEIKTDSTIESKDIAIIYYNGKMNRTISDENSKGVLRLQAPFHAEFASFNLEYRGISSTTFFINENISSIEFYLDSKNPTDLNYRNAVNVLPVFDVASNALFKKLLAYRKREADVFEKFRKEHGVPEFKNDSIQILFNNVFKDFNRKALEFLKLNSDSYFSFFFFRHQILSPTLAYLSDDPSYLGDLLGVYKRTFPEKYLKSDEGQAIIERLSALANPLREGNAAPAFKTVDVKGREISLGSFAGKYILIDFWATWCGPCMKALPDLIDIRKAISSDTLVIIGVNRDKDRSKFEKAINIHKMNWVHTFDDKDYFVNLFGVTALPTTVLINREGKIVYIGTGNDPEMKRDIEKIIKLN